MTTITGKITIQHWLMAGLCLFLALPALGQGGRGGGGGGGVGGGGGSRGGGAGAAGGAGASSTREYPSAGTIGSTTFRVDAEGRMMTVIGDSNALAAVSNALAKLDRPKPQVMI